jgi:hypothetical protein
MPIMECILYEFTIKLLCIDSQNYESNSLCFEKIVELQYQHVSLTSINCINTGLIIFGSAPENNLGAFQTMGLVKGK